jgi:type II restriction/modification system DNA methylase subunit YeeA
VLSLQESKGLSIDELATHLAPYKVQRATINALLSTFEHAKTFGSLIQIPYSLKSHLALLPQVLAVVKQSGDMYASAAADDLLPLVQQAQVLAMQFDAVVANPPYMGGKGMIPSVRDFARSKFPDSKSDLFAMFMERAFEWCKPTGVNSMVTMHSWMFLSSYEVMRERLLKSHSIQSMAHFGARAFSEIPGEVVQTTAFVFQNRNFAQWQPVFIRLTDGNEEQKQAILKASEKVRFVIAQEDLGKIPGSPVAYWVSDRVRELFSSNQSIGQVAAPRKGNTTTDNARFLRFWPEVNIDKVIFDSSSATPLFNGLKKWVPYNKGGGYRKWFGFNEFLINWENGGKEIKAIPHSVIANEQFFFKPGLTWSTVSSGKFSIRSFPQGYVFDNGGCCVFGDQHILMQLLGLMNSVVFETLYGQISPTLNFQSGEVAKVPFIKVDDGSNINKIVSTLIQVFSDEYNESESSWDFQSSPLIPKINSFKSLKKSWDDLAERKQNSFKHAVQLEEENNRIFLKIYGLLGEISPEVPESQITLASADREKDCQRLISYAIGCMMGRYSLDEPGLIYAHAGNVGFEPSRYATFPADADGIVPITDELWFADDAPSRIREFLRAVWGPDTLEENMAWLAESLGTKASETPDETIRRYIADKFFKDHLQTYKKRPIYWLFSSGKQGAFQALVYLHRYHEGTLARLRAEYVVPLTGKIQSRIEMLQKDAAAASSTAARNKLAKEVEKLKKKHVELLAYDEQLRHYADMRINLDLDDGVKVNYGKFGDLLDSVKIVTGGAGDE